jgi:translation initiation factor 3 subunit G
MSKTQTRGRTDWAEDIEDDPLSLPPPQVTKNKDGTETIISYRFDDAGRKIKTTRKIRKTVVRQTVNPRVAERRTWAKFGLEAGKPAGPSTDSTSIAENIDFRLSVNWKASQVEEKSALEQKKATLKDTKIKCRICGGDHWTSKCPYKDTMAPEGEPGPGLPTDEDQAPAAGGGLGAQSGSYVPPHLRGKGGAGERMGGGKYGHERDDLATLRVTNLSEGADESELKELFGRWGNVTRVFLAKDRDTGRAKGFAFVSYADRAQAERACEKMDGCKSAHLQPFTLMLIRFTVGYLHLILRVEFAKKST